MTPAELWAEYQPRFNEAKKLDKQEQTLVFIIQPVRLGRFWLAPLTLRRLLFLEAIESPFAGSRRELDKRAVLELLWILNPNFSPSRFRGKLFFARHWFLKWQEYAMEVVELMREGMEMMQDAKVEQQSNDPEASWVASTIDGLASQYHWRVDEILDLPLLQLNVLGRALAARVSAMAGSKEGNVKFNRHSDSVRAEYLADVNKKGKGVGRG